MVTYSYRRYPVNGTTRLQIHYDLSPSLAKILDLLAHHEVVTNHMIETEYAIIGDAKVAIHRLRERLGDGINVKSRRTVGYWLEPEDQALVQAIEAGSNSSLGGGDDGKFAAA
jgi:hypothetical protein